MSTLIEAARERANKLATISLEAQKEANAAWAELARLDLITLAEATPGITGMRYETEYAYNDEGGYFISVTAYPLTEEGEDSDRELDPDYSFTEAMESYGHEVLAKLCGVDEESESGEVTVEQAKAVSF